MVNTQVIDRGSARDQGFQLANDPLSLLDRASLARLEWLAMDWYTRARLVTVDHHTLNQSLINGEIDFYISNGVYTVSPAWLSGQHHLATVTPCSGAMQGQGGIIFTEITSLIKTCKYFEFIGRVFIVFA